MTFSLRSHTSSMLDGGGFKGIWPRLNVFDLNWFSSSGVSELSGEKRLSDVPLAELPAAEEGALVPNPAVAFPKRPLLPAGADSLDPNAPAPAPVEKLNPDAEPNAGVDVGLSEVGPLKEKELADAAEGPPEDEPKPDANPEEEPNPDGGCVGATGFCPNPNDEPNPLLPAAKLKVLAWTGAALPNPTFWNENVAICSTQTHGSCLPRRSTVFRMKALFPYLCFQRRTQRIQIQLQVLNQSLLLTHEAKGCSTLQAIENQMTLSIIIIIIISCCPYLLNSPKQQTCK